jgi:hypothetical protein
MKIQAYEIVELYNAINKIAEASDKLTKSSVDKMIHDALIKSEEIMQKTIDARDVEIADLVRRLKLEQEKVSDRDKDIERLMMNRILEGRSKGGK